MKTLKVTIHQKHVSCCQKLNFCFLPWEGQEGEVCEDRGGWGDDVITNTEVHMGVKSTNNETLLLFLFTQLQLNIIIESRLLDAAG